MDNAVKYTPAGGKIAVSVVLWEMLQRSDISFYLCTSGQLDPKQKVSLNAMEA